MADSTPPSAESQALRRPRLRFTIRSLMIVVAIVASIFGLRHLWGELLPFLIIVVMPVAGFSDLPARVPPQRPAQRFGILVAMLGFVLALTFSWSFSFG